MDVMLCGPMGFMRAVYSILRHELQVRPRVPVGLPNDD